jgi:hypothetical protein
VLVATRIVMRPSAKFWQH